MRLFNPLCLSVGRSVAINFFGVFDVFGHSFPNAWVSLFHCRSCPPAQDWGSRVSGLVSYLLILDCLFSLVVLSLVVQLRLILLLISATSTTSISCHLEDNVQYFGHDMENVYALNVQACQQSCIKKHPRCVGKEIRSKYSELPLNCCHVYATS